MSTIARKISAGAATLGLAGAAALAAPGVAQAQNDSEGAWGAGCTAFTFNMCDAVMVASAPALVMMDLLDGDDDDTFTMSTGSIMMQSMPVFAQDMIDAAATWLMGADQEITFGEPGNMEVTFFLSSYSGLGMTVTG